MIHSQRLCLGALSILLFVNCLSQLAAPRNPHPIEPAVIIGLMMLLLVTALFSPRSTRDRAPRWSSDKD